MAHEKLFHVGVKGLMTNTQGEILLLEVNTARFKKAAAPHWDIPGGRIQVGQSARDALAREIEEEIGVTDIGEPEFFTAVISNMEIPLSDTETAGLVLMVYKVEIPGDSAIKLSEEHLSYEWVSAQTAAERLAFKYPAEFTDKLLQNAESARLNG